MDRGLSVYQNARLAVALRAAGCARWLPHIDATFPVWDIAIWVRRGREDYSIVTIDRNPPPRRNWTVDGVDAVVALFDYDGATHVVDAPDIVAAAAAVVRRLDAHGWRPAT